MCLICTNLLSYALIQPPNFSLFLTKCAFYKYKISYKYIIKIFIWWRWQNWRSWRKPEFVVILTIKYIESINYCIKTIYWLKQTQQRASMLLFIKLLFTFKYFDILLEHKIWRWWRLMVLTNLMLIEPASREYNDLNISNNFSEIGRWCWHIMVVTRKY